MKAFALLLLVVVGTNANLSSMKGRMPSVNGVDPAALPDKGSCTKANPTEGCDSILDTWSGKSGSKGGSKGAKSKLSTLQKGIQDGTKSKDDVQKMCAMGAYYRTCISNTKITCGSKTDSKINSEKRSNPMMDEQTMGQFCEGGYVKPDLKSRMEKSNLGSCLTGAKGTELKGKFDTIKSKAETKTGRVSDSDMTGAGKGSQDAKMKLQRAKSACASVRSSMMKMMMLFRKNKDLGCNEDAKKTAIESAKMSVPPGLLSQCKLPDPTQAGVLSQKGQRNDKERETVAFYGLSHMRVFNQTDETITCEDYESGANITLLEHDSLEIVGEVEPYDGTNNATILKSVFVKFRDSNMDEVDGLSMKSGNTGKLPENMDGNRKSIGKGTGGKAGGKVEGKITMERKSDEHTEVKDENSGMYLSVRKYNVKGSKPVYSMVGRLPKSMLENSGGRLVEGCTVNQDIKGKLGLSKRRKRSTTSTEGTYDTTVTGDSGASVMASYAQSDITSASTTDSTFNAGEQTARVTGFGLLILSAITAFVMA